MVTAVVAVLLGISVPAGKKIMDSFDASTGARSLINAALSSARAMAMAGGTSGSSGYAGVRFQEDRDGNSYMIFIVHDPAATNLANGFRAVDGKKPIRLPMHVGVLDGIEVNRNQGTGALTDNPLSDSLLSDNAANLQNGRNRNLMDTATFNVVFSPSGHVVTHEVRVRNRDGAVDNSSTDAIFNTVFNVDPANPVGMFYQDDYGWDSGSANPNYGIGPEMSRKGFIIFDKRKYQEVNASFRWSEYLGTLPVETVSPYTGELVKTFEGQL